MLNKFFNMHINKSPFQMIYGISPKNSSYLRKLNKGETSCTKANVFVH